MLSHLPYTGPTGSERLPVDVGFTLKETNPTVEAVRRLSRRPRCEIDCFSSQLLSVLDCSINKALSHALTACGLIGNDIFDPCSAAGRNIENNQREHSQNPVILIQCTHQVQAVLSQKLLDFLARQRLCGRGKLRK